MKKEINIKINDFHEFLAEKINHPERSLKWSSKKGAVVECNWGQRLVRHLYPARKLAQDVQLVERVVEMRNNAPQGSPFKLLGRAQYAFTNKSLKTLDYQIRCIEQGCVLGSRALASKDFGERKFFYEFGAVGNYEEWNSTREAADLFYDRQMKWDC